MRERMANFNVQIGQYLSTIAESL